MSFNSKRGTLPLTIQKRFSFIINELLAQLGVKVIRKNKSPYEYLLTKERYRQTEVDLFGRRFQIADGHSFYYSHREIFINEIYKFQTENPSPVIVDCGSNYGTSIVYFKHLCPHSIITGIEADPNIFKILKINIGARDFGNVTLLHKAVSTKEGPIQFFCEGADGGREHYLEEAKAQVEVETISLDELIETDVDFLKMDIEGSETDVLVSSKKLNRVKNIFIEYHSFMDEEQKLGDLLTGLIKNGFRYYIHTQFCSPKPFTEKRSQNGMDMQLNIFAIRNSSI